MNDDAGRVDDALEAWFGQVLQDRSGFIQDRRQGDFFIIDVLCGSGLENHGPLPVEYGPDRGQNEDAWMDLKPVLCAGFLQDFVNRWQLSEEFLHACNIA